MSPIHEASPYQEAAPRGSEVPPPGIRARALVMSLAKFCKACLRHGTADCAVRCPAAGAEAIARDLLIEETGASPAPAPATPQRTAVPHEQAAPMRSKLSDGRHVSADREAARRHMLASMPLGTPVPSASISYPTHDSVLKAQDLVVLVARGLIAKRLDEAEGKKGRFLYTRLPEEQRHAQP